jgi:putative zinc finger/helix-turn-helix YgiT family protein
MEERTVRCVMCGAEMTTQRENYRYIESGLSHVTLRDVEVSRCPQCGKMEVAIPQIEDLHRTIAQALLRKPSRLIPEEIHYLRTYRGWSGTDLAVHMGTTPETVSRWEHGATPIGKTADRLLRLLVATQFPGSEDVVHTLPAIATTKLLQGIRLSLFKDQDGWHVASAVVAG